MSGKPSQPLPTALVVGPMKCGTSWIHDYLAARGDVCLPHLVKETFYFDRFHGRGTDWYAQRFSHYNPSVHRAIVEVAPSLFHVSDTLPNIVRAELGDIPVLVTLRDPIDRAWSHYQHMTRGYTRAPLAEAIVTHPEIINASQYSVHLPCWQASFSRVAVVRQDQLRADADAYATAVCAALDIPPLSVGYLGQTRSNAATAPRFYILAQLGRNISHALRRAGLYRLVDLAKSAGLKRLFFGGTTSQTNAPTAAERLLLNDKLSHER